MKPSVLRRIFILICTITLLLILTSFYGIRHSSQINTSFSVQTIPTAKSLTNEKSKMKFTTTIIDSSKCNPCPWFLLRHATNKREWLNDSIINNRSIYTVINDNHICNRYDKRLIDLTIEIKGSLNNSSTLIGIFDNISTNVQITKYLTLKSFGLRWSVESATQWYQSELKDLKHIMGCNYIPAYAINQLEHWQKESFDLSIIQYELQIAKTLGFNVIRVFLHYIPYLQDKSGFLHRIHQFLSIADSFGIRTMFVFFDDCWNPISNPGVQPAPKPERHNSGWLQCPDHLYRNNQLTPQKLFNLRDYVMDIVNMFRLDRRVWMWDVWNEPGNSGYGLSTLPLLQASVAWIRSLHPIQPITMGTILPHSFHNLILTGWINEWMVDVGFWFDNIELNTFQFCHSDIASFHFYGNSQVTSEKVMEIKDFVLTRPLICTEYMARTIHSMFHNILPIFIKHQIGAIHWGLIAGKTNTNYPWIETQKKKKKKKTFLLWFKRWQHFLYEYSRIILYELIKPYFPFYFTFLEKIPNDDEGSTSTTTTASTTLDLISRKRVNGSLSWVNIRRHYLWHGVYLPSRDTEPPIWFHDVVRVDGSPYDEKEIIYLQQLQTTLQSLNGSH